MPRASSNTNRGIARSNPIGRTSCTANQGNGPAAVPIENYILQVEIASFQLAGEGLQSVNRTISCPATIKFQKLHKVLQAAFGWADVHDYTFTIHPHATDTFCWDSGCGRGDSEPCIDIMDRETIRSAEDIDAMPMPTGFFGPLVKPIRKPVERTRLNQIFEQPGVVEKFIDYEYDHGDGWEHKIAIVGRAPATARATCLEGSGHPIAEDSGGFCGWTKLVKAYRSENPDCEQKMKMSWFEKVCENKDPLGLGEGRDAVFDIEDVNRKLASLSLR